jgi:hypothetical protein
MIWGRGQWLRSLRGGQQSRAYWSTRLPGVFQSARELDAKIEICPTQAQTVKSIPQFDSMKDQVFTVIVASVLAITAVIGRQKEEAEILHPGTQEKAGAPIVDAIGPKAPHLSPIFITEIPPEYRDWRLISVAREEGSLDDIRAILGNDLAIEAYRKGTQPFPEGAAIARIAWSYLSSEENNKVFGKPQSFVAGPPKNGVQFMVKDSKKYAETGGWGYAQFDDRKLAPKEKLQSCFPCHQAIKDRDFVFTRYSH